MFMKFADMLMSLYTISLFHIIIIMLYDYRYTWKNNVAYIYVLVSLMSTFVALRRGCSKNSVCKVRIQLIHILFFLKIYLLI